MVIKNFHWRDFFLEPMKIQSRQLWTLIRLYPNTSLDKEKLPFGPIQTDADGILSPLGKLLCVLLCCCSANATPKINFFHPYFVVWRNISIFAD